MDLSIEISTSSDLPISRDTNIICFNFNSTNEVFNMGTNTDWKTDKDAIGVWKIKQLKK